MTLKELEERIVDGLETLPWLRDGFVNHEMLRDYIRKSLAEVARETAKACEVEEVTNEQFEEIITHADEDLKKTQAVSMGIGHRCAISAQKSLAQKFIGALPTNIPKE